MRGWLGLVPDLKLRGLKEDAQGDRGDRHAAQLASLTVHNGANWKERKGHTKGEKGGVAYGFQTMWKMNDAES